MFKNKINTLIAFILLALMVSCNSTEESKTELDFKSLKYGDQVHLFGNDNFPAFDIDIKLILPSDSIAYDGLYHAILMTYFDSLYQDSWTAEKDMNLLADVLIQDYRSLEEGLDLDSTDFGSSYSWQIVKSNEILFSNEKYVSFVNEEYSYTGGAHGNTIRNHFIFDLEQNTLLEAKDLLDLTKCEDLIQLQKNSLVKTGQDIDGFWEDGFRCDQNFYALDKGFVFHYDQYEIASYAAGPMDIFISFEELKPYLLQPEIAKEFTK